jgi:hypothetical protein
VFSITPKKFLHDLVADHTDTFSLSVEKEASVKQKGINCNADDLVVKASLIEQDAHYSFILPVLYVDYTGTYFLSHSYINQEPKDSRGPPALL